MTEWFIFGIVVVALLVAAAAFWDKFFGDEADGFFIGRDQDEI